MVVRNDQSFLETLWTDKAFDKKVRVFQLPAAINRVAWCTLVGTRVDLLFMADRDVAVVAAKDSRGLHCEQSSGRRRTLCYRYYSTIDNPLNIGSSTIETTTIRATMATISRVLHLTLQARVRPHRHYPYENERLPRSPERLAGNKFCL
jgi:hypothetical protein